MIYLDKFFLLVLNGNIIIIHECKRIRETVSLCNFCVQLQFIEGFGSIADGAFILTLRIIIEKHRLVSTVDCSVHLQQILFERVLH